MSRFMRMFMSLCLVSLTAVTSYASAANYSLWINGRTGGGVVGNYDSFTYWGPGTAAGGVNKDQGGKFSAVLKNTATFGGENPREAWVPLEGTIIGAISGGGQGAAIGAAMFG